MSAKIVIASYDEDFKLAIVRNISGKNVEVVATFNAGSAIQYFSKTEPNVLIIDIDSGFSASSYITNILDTYNLLIILTGSSPAKAFPFYSYGVKDYIIKVPDFNSADGREFLTAISQRIVTFFSQSVSQKSKSGFARTTPTMSGERTSKLARSHNTAVLGYKKNIVIAIAASTGGPDALMEVIPKLPKEMPPIIIVQHMPKLFTRQFAQRMDNYSVLNVKEAENGEKLYSGVVYVAPGDFHIMVTKRASDLCVECRGGAKVHGVRPSADVLFNSIAEVVKSNSVGIILTGMGADGARGLSLMKSFGASTIAQDEHSCVVYGMPKAAKEIGAVDFQVGLSDIAGVIIKAVNAIK